MSIKNTSTGAMHRVIVDYPRPPRAVLDPHGTKIQKLLVTLQGSWEGGGYDGKAIDNSYEFKDIQMAQVFAGVLRELDANANIHVLAAACERPRKLD